MSIEFACDCGKQFRVSEEYAGKRTKCPTCGIALVVPAMPESPADDDAAYRALSEGPDPEPTSRDWREPSAPPLPAPTGPRPLPIPPKQTKTTPEKKSKKIAYTDPYAPREKQWNVDWGRVAGGGVGLLVGCGLLFGGLAVNRFFIWSPVIIIGGLIGIINGLLHKE